MSASSRHRTNGPLTEADENAAGLDRRLFQRARRGLAAAARRRAIAREADPNSGR